MVYAPFGQNIFGETLYGAPPTVNVSTVISILPVNYDGLQLSWTRPGGNWTEQVLVRSSFGVPLRTADGVVLLDQTTGFSQAFTDTGLKPGRFYYYSLFVFDTDLAPPQFILAGSAQGLVLTDYNFAGTFLSWLPDWYYNQDTGLGPNPQSGPLQRFLGLLGYEMDWIRSEIESLFLLTNVDLVSGALLTQFGGNLGVGYEPELGMTRSRVLAKNAVHLYQERGTLPGASAAASSFSGYGCIATVGKNLEIQLDDCAFDKSNGHWNHLLNCTVSSVSATSIGVTPAHGSYTPADSTNVGLITAVEGATQTTVSISTCSSQATFSSLTTQLTQGSTYNALTVSALSQPIGVGDIILINPGASPSQSVIALSNVNTGAVSIPTYSFTANSTYTVGTSIQTEAADSIVLGIPVVQQATPPIYVLSGSFQPYPQATPVKRSWKAQIDWYAINGGLISSSQGAAVTEVNNAWVRPYVAASPPAGAAFFGRTFVSTAALANGERHLFDGEQVEVNTQATPGPSPWDPPRDIKLNLFPLRQNLFINSAAIVNNAGWTPYQATIVRSTTGTWPVLTTTGFVITQTSGSSINGTAASVLVNSGRPYTFSGYFEAVTTGRVVTLSINFYTSAGAFIQTVVGTPINDVAGSFTRASLVDVIAPVNAYSAQATFTISGVGAGEQHNFGAMLFEPTAYLQPYFDANFAPSTDYLWEGATGASISDYYPSLQLKLSRLTTAMVDYVPIGATFTLITGAQAFTNTNQSG